MSGWWSRNQRREAPQILSDGSQNQLVLGAPWTTKPKPTKPEMRFKCANRISIFLRSRRDCSKPSVPIDGRPVDE
jgi:hypothetical protein